MSKQIFSGLLVAFIVLISVPAFANSCLDDLNTDSNTPVKDLHNCIKELEAKIEEFRELSGKIEKIEKQLTDADTKKTQWPTGKYGIFKHGECPPGFRAVTNEVLAIKQFSSNPPYLVPKTFGDSLFREHNNGRDGVTSDFVLAVCMKDG